MKAILLAIAAVITMGLTANAAMPSPTGNPSKDSKAAANYIVEIINNVNSIEEFDDIENKLNELQVEFEGYYNANPNLKEEFERVGSEYADSEEFSELLQTAFVNAMKRIGLDDESINEFMKQEFSVGVFSDNDEEDFNDGMDTTVAIDIAPTGDPAADAETVAEYMIKLIKSVNTLEDADMLEAKMATVEDVYGEYYEEGTELGDRFEQEMNKCFEDATYQKRLTEAYNKMSERIERSMPQE
ncbi:MAG: hypothetical protein IK092_07660 [Muribaculaceae bacterium]|nr:hypothetical protein [Muribaculaceae bacterium]